LSPITFTQQGIITQCELAKILIITSEGVLEVAFPLTDDDRRDMEIHLRGKFARSLALQIKSTLHLAHRFRAYQLSMFFSVPKERLVTHPNFGYFFGYLISRRWRLPIRSSSCRQRKSIHTPPRAWTVTGGPSTSAQASIRTHRTAGSRTGSRLMWSVGAFSTFSGRSRSA